MAEPARAPDVGRSRGGPGRAIRERRGGLMAAIHARGACSVADLAVIAAASEATIRRDLAALERQGMVDRTWGGATAHVVLRYREGFARRAAVGAAADAIIRAYHLDVFFLSCSGVTEAGFGRRNPARVAGLGEVDDVVVDPA